MTLSSLPFLTLFCLLIISFRMLGPGRLRRKSSHELILSLAAADLLVGLVSIPLTVAARIGFFKDTFSCSAAQAAIQGKFHSFQSTRNPLVSISNAFQVLSRACSWTDRSEKKTERLTDPFSSALCLALRTRVHFNRALFDHGEPQLGQKSPYEQDLHWI